MNFDFNSLINDLEELDVSTNPQWGKMNSTQMLSHCNNFIEVSQGTKKIGFLTKLFGRVFGKLFLFYLKSINFNILKYKKNSSTLKELRVNTETNNFQIQKNRLIENLTLINRIDTKKTDHQIYGRLDTGLFKRLMYFHTSYHFNQFGILSTN